jgi:hypothetical protein
LTVGDQLADDVAGWRTDKWEFDTLAPDDERKGQREALKGWLKEQFARIAKGEKHQLKTKPEPLRFATWRLDAP